MRRPSWPTPCFRRRWGVAVMVVTVEVEESAAVRRSVSSSRRARMYGWSTSPFRPATGFWWRWRPRSERSHGRHRKRWWSSEIPQL